MLYQLLHYSLASQTVRRDALVRRLKSRRASHSHIQGVTKKKPDCCQKKFITTFSIKLGIVPFKVLPL